MNEWMTPFTCVCRDWPLDGTFICVCTFSRFKTFTRRKFSTQSKFSDVTSTRTRLVLFQSFGDFSPFGSSLCSSSGGKALKLWIFNPGFLISICLMICLVRRNQRQAWKTIFAHPSEHKLLKGDDSTIRKYWNIIQGHLLTTLNGLGKEWRISFGFRPTDYRFRLFAPHKTALTTGCDISATRTTRASYT